MNRQHHLRQWFLTHGGVVLPQGIFGNVWTHFWLFHLGGGVARDVVKHPAVHQTTPITKSDLTQNVSRAKIEKLCSKVT